MDLRKKFEVSVRGKRMKVFIIIIYDYYYHDKIIKANRVSIKKNEFLDYVIDSIPNVHLRNQTRMQNFTLLAELLQVFKKINIYFDASEAGKY